MWRRGGSGWLAQPIDPVVQLWALRVLVRLGAERDFVRPDGFHDTQLARLLGLAEDEDVQESDLTPRDICLRLRGMLREAEEAAVGNPLPNDLSYNLERLCGLIGVCEADRVILAFAILLASRPVLARATALLGELTSRAAIEVVAGILDLKPEEVSDAIKPSGTLARAGLLRLDVEFNRRLDTKLDLLSRGFADVMMLPSSAPVDLLREMVSVAPPPLLGMGHYEHVSNALRILLPYLRRAIRDQRAGVNILVYGTPGTGKTQLARVLAKEVGSDLFEISSEDEDGDPVSGEARLRALRVAQCLFRNRSAMLAFDEVEDLFLPDPFSISRKNAAGAKAWVIGRSKEMPRRHSGCATRLISSIRLSLAASTSSSNCRFHRSGSGNGSSPIPATEWPTHRQFLGSHRSSASRRQSLQERARSSNQ